MFKLRLKLRHQSRLIPLRVLLESNNNQLLHQDSKVVFQLIRLLKRSKVNKPRETLQLPLLLQIITLVSRSQQLKRTRLFLVLKNKVAVLRKLKHQKALLTELLLLLVTWRNQLKNPHKNNKSLLLLDNSNNNKHPRKYLKVLNNQLSNHSNNKLVLINVLLMISWMNCQFKHLHKMTSMAVLYLSCNHLRVLMAVLCSLRREADHNLNSNKNKLWKFKQRRDKVLMLTCLLIHPHPHKLKFNHKFKHRSTLIHNYKHHKSHKSQIFKIRLIYKLTPD